MHPAHDATETWRRFYTIFSAHDVHAADDLHATLPFDAVEQMDDAERILWRERTPKRLVVDSTGHMAYAMLENGLDQPDVLVSVLGWSGWGRLLAPNNSTLAFV